MAEICLLDIKLEYFRDGVTDFSYASGLSLLGFESVIWRPSDLFLSYYDEFTLEQYGYPILDISVSRKLHRDIERRKKEMLALLEKGRTIFIIAPKPDICLVSSSNQEGFNEVSIADTLPIGVNFEHTEGSNLEFKGDEPFKSFFETNKNHMKYYASIHLPEGKPFLYIKDSDAVVGTYTNFLNGKLVFIPDYIDSYVAEDEFIKSILQLNEDFKKDLEIEKLPEWSQNYILPNELEEIVRLFDIQQQIESLMSRSDKQKELIKTIETYKVLFTGTGKPLEQIVGKVLVELGFEVTEGLPGRDDLILRYNDKVAVVEVKGVGKSAAEKHAAQLEKWVSGYIEKFGVNPKGMLIVNSFCNLPLHERVEDTFPNQMLSYSERRDHALISTLQLLGAYLDVKKNPDIKEKIIEDLFSTNGKYESYTNWLEFIDHTGS